MTSVLDSNIDAGIETFQKLRGLDPLVKAAARRIAEALLNGHKLLACGNGGSAADASHLTNEFVCRSIVTAGHIRRSPWQRTEETLRRSETIMPSTTSSAARYIALGCGEMFLRHSRPAGGARTSAVLW
jgi:hypothetical protein